MLNNSLPSDAHALRLIPLLYPCIAKLRLYATVHIFALPLLLSAVHRLRTSMLDPCGVPLCPCGARLCHADAEQCSTFALLCQAEAEQFKAFAKHRHTSPSLQKLVDESSLTAVSPLTHTTKSAIIKPFVNDLFQRIVHDHYLDVAG